MITGFYHRIRILVFFLAGISGQVVYTQSHPGGMELIYPQGKRVSFHFDLINNPIIIPVIINNSDTLHFILDTGINNTIISELSLGDSLSLKYARQIRMNGLGSGKMVPGRPEKRRQAGPYQRKPHFTHDHEQNIQDILW